MLKPSKLNEDEAAVMQSHARLGYDQVGRIAFLARAAEIVTHPERYDGTGYLQGLVGQEIPLARGFSRWPDTLDPMTSDRPCRWALLFAAARAETPRGSGRQFHREVVRVFLSILEQVWESIRREVAGQPTHARATHERIESACSLHA